MAENDDKKDVQAQHPNIPTSSGNQSSKKKVTKVVLEGKMIERTPSLGKRIRAAFTGDDVKTVGEYIVVDVIVPTIKNTIIDVVQEGIVRLVGGTRRPSGSTPMGYKTPYNSMSSRTPGGAPSSRAVTSGSPSDYSEVVFDNRADAHEILDQMTDLLDRYGIVSTADLKNMLGQSENHVDHKWGWKNLSTADVVRTREGWFLVDLPKPVEL